MLGAMSLGNKGRLTLTFFFFMHFFLRLESSRCGWYHGWGRLKKVGGDALSEGKTGLNSCFIRMQIVNRASSGVRIRTQWLDVHTSTQNSGSFKMCFVQPAPVT